MNKLYVPKCIKCDDLIDNHEAMYQGDSNEYCELCGIENLTKHGDGFYYDAEDEHKEAYHYKIHCDLNDYKEVVTQGYQEKALYEFNAVLEAVSKWYEYDTSTLRRMLSNGHISTETFQVMCSKLDVSIFKEIYLDGGDWK